MTFKLRLFIIFLILIVSALQVGIGFADDVDEECEGLTQEECQKKFSKDLDKIEDQIEKNQKIVEQKQKQEQTLKNQLYLLNKEEKALKDDIEDTEKDMDKIEDKIKSLKEKIESKNKAIISQKKILGALIQSYYESSKFNVLGSLVAQANNFTASVSRRDHLSELQSKVKDTLKNIQEMKEKMEEENEELNSDMEKKKEFVEKLEKKSENLDDKQRQKQGLIAQTQGEEAKYQKKIAKLEAQKQELLGDIDNLYNANSDEIQALLASLPKPKSGLASTKWYYSQKDSRWGNQRIGQSNSLMKDYGCAISSVAMIFTYYDEGITPGSLAKRPIFYWDLINWPASWGDVELVKNTQHSGVSWSEIDKEIGKDHPVIVFIRARGGAGHYVVIHGKDKNGDYVVHDPYFGANIYLDSSFKLLSKLFGTKVSKSSIDQMILYKD